MKAYSPTPATNLAKGSGHRRAKQRNGPNDPYPCMTVNELIGLIPFGWFVGFHLRFFGPFG